MKSLTVRRSSLSNSSLDILKKLSFDINEEIDSESSVRDDVMPQIDYETKVNDKALGVLYKNLHGSNHQQRKPLVYFFIGLIVGVLSTLFLSAVVLVSDKDSLENDVKTVKENILEEKQVNQTELPDETTVSLPIEGVTEVSEDGSKVYVVKEGDTLGGIVNRLYGDSSTYNPEKVERFKEANGLKSIHVLKIGQKLVIPD